MHHEHLVRRFADAGLTVVVFDRPIVGGVIRGNGDIVQIDIQRDRRREWFRIYPGAADNRIEVVGIDKKISQLVLMVHEVAREFFEDVAYARWCEIVGKDGWVETLAQTLGVQARDIFVRNARHGRTILNVTIRHRTPSAKRHFLCGVDERQLFIAQLPRAVSSVREAHASLKSTTVSLAEGQGFRAERQGEWFFVEPTPQELMAIDVGFRKKIITVERNVPIGPFTVAGGLRGPRVRQFGGNPHTADELIVLPGTPVENGFVVRNRREVFIRGRVRHVDHATVKFSDWRKVIRNAEANEGKARGVFWVD